MQRLIFSFLIFGITFTSSFAQKLDSREFHNYRRNLKNSYLKFQNEKEGRVVFLGGSITFNPGWRDSVCHYLQQKFPETKFDFINAGIPSMGSTPGAFRFKRDVLKNGRVDLLFEEAAVNDDTNQRTPTEIIRGMEGIIRHALTSNPEMDVVMMYFADPGKIAEYRNQQVPEVIQLHENIAQRYDVPSIDLAKEVTRRIDAGEFNWDRDFKDLHPSPFGQNVYFQSVKAFLENEYNPGFKGQEITALKIPEPVDPFCYGDGVLIEPNPTKPIRGWKMVENWRPSDGKGTRSNYVDVPMLVGNYPGKIIKFKFTGNAVGIAVAAGPDAGVIEYSIDNSAWKKLDLFTRWSSQLHLPWYYTLSSALKNKRHVLQLRLADEKNPESSGKTCRLRYFYINR